MEKSVCACGCRQKFTPHIYYSRKGLDTGHERGATRREARFIRGHNRPDGLKKWREKNPKGNLQPMQEGWLRAFVPAGPVHDVLRKKGITPQIIHAKTGVALTNCYRYFKSTRLRKDVAERLLRIAADLPFILPKSTQMKQDAREALSFFRSAMREEPRSVLAAHEGIRLISRVLGSSHIAVKQMLYRSKRDVHTRQGIEWRLNQRIVNPDRKPVPRRRKHPNLSRKKCEFCDKTFQPKYYWHNHQHYVQRFCSYKCFGDSRRVNAGATV